MKVLLSNRVENIVAKVDIDHYHNVLKNHHSAADTSKRDCKWNRFNPLAHIDAF